MERASRTFPGRRPWARHALVMLLALSSWAAPVVAASLDDAEHEAVRSLMERAVAAQRYDEPDRARALLEEALAIYEGRHPQFPRTSPAPPPPELLFSLGRVHEALEQWEEALALFDRCAALPMSPEDVARFHEPLAAARLRVREALKHGRLFVTVFPRDAVVTVDGSPAADALVAPGRRLLAGDHVVAASAQGYVTAQRTVTVRGARENRLDIRLERESSVLPARPEPPVVIVREPESRPAMRADGVFRLGAEVATGAVFDTASGGRAVARQSVALRLVAALRWGAFQVDLGLGALVESPQAFVVRPGARVFLGSVFFVQAGLQGTFARGLVAGAIVIGAGVDIPLGRGVGLVLGTAFLPWFAGAGFVDVLSWEFAVGARYAF